MNNRRAHILISLGIMWAGTLRPVSGEDVFSEIVRSTEPLTPEEQRTKFHLPPGFEIDLVAAEPDIAKPMNLAFDSRGRLWVTSSVEYPFAAPEDRHARDRVNILEDRDGDGRLETVSTFADELNIPIGIYPFNGGRSALAYSIPNIWRLDDTDGDGRADKREVLFGPIGEPEDTHGMQNAFTRGFDGWLYICHGFRNSSVVKGRDGSEITLESGNTYRVQLDGSRVEQYTWGQVNPFGMCFDPAGNLYTADCHSSPIYQLIREGRYPSFGKPHDGLGFAPQLMQHSHGSTAICGLVYYDRDSNWPGKFRDTMFVGNVMGSRVHRDKIHWEGASPVAEEQPDFLTCDDPWFRPVDIQMGPDGAIYIADFYNRIIGHYEVELEHPDRDRFRGRIWRVRYTGRDSGPKKMPDLARAKIGPLIRAMGNRNLTQRLLATHETVDRIGQAAIDPLRVALAAPDTNAFRTVHCLWALQRIGGLDNATLKIVSDDSRELVRIHLMRLAGERKTLSQAWLEIVRAGLEGSNEKVKREAASALARHSTSGDIDRLIEAIRTLPADDDYLVHTLRIALCNQVRAAPELFDGLDTASPDAEVLSGIAPAVATAPAAAFLFRYAQEQDVPESEWHTALRHASRYLPENEISSLTEFAQERFSGDPDAQLGSLNVIEAGLEQRGARKEDHLEQWAANLAARILHSTQHDEDENSSLEAAMSLAARYGVVSLEPEIGRLMQDRKAAHDVRVAALEAVAKMDAGAYRATFLKIAGNSKETPALRGTAAIALIESVGDSATVAPAEIEAIAKVLGVVPARLQKEISLALAAHRSGAAQLFDAIEAGTVSAYYLQDKAVTERLAASGFPGWESRVDDLTEDFVTVEKRLKAIIFKRRDAFDRSEASPERGALIFEQQCAVCHRIGAAGGLIAPQLDGIGNRGAERLIEDILAPNFNVDRAFRYTIVTRANGETVNGLFRREEGESFIFADTAGEEFSIPHKDIAERKESRLSLMPPIYADTLPEKDFYDLLSFLLDSR